MPYPTPTPASSNRIHSSVRTSFQTLPSSAHSPGTTTLRFVRLEIVKQGLRYLTRFECREVVLELKRRPGR